jgi:hypothetical protein
MAKKVINALLIIVFSVPLFTGIYGSPDPPMAYLSSSEICSGENNGEISFQKPCDMDHCNPGMPKCPLCSSSSSINLYLNHAAEAYLPTLTSSLMVVSVDTLSDQGFVKSVFHPPTSLS